MYVMYVIPHISNRILYFFFFENYPSVRNISVLEFLKKIGKVHIFVFTENPA